MKESYVYILMSKNKQVLYVGVTTQLKQRVWQHKNGVTPGFTSKYHVHDLVYYEVFDLLENAILREKKLKKWKRDWKDKLILDFNPNLSDLYYEI
ncbi:GIY-YIG nuclease family protein [Aliivibrio wodanis]|uniref:GIY-YIG nuclease family protein n=1 Tax=Aliivibrio wodanis TaxID=80852 RepID=UPI00406C1D2A